MNIALIMNPQSAAGRTGRYWAEHEAEVRRRIPEITVLTTQRPGHATELARQALRQGYDRIVSAGGDGTHFEVINGFFQDDRLINPRASLAVLPLGTGSDLARSVRLKNFKTAVTHLASPAVRRIDVGRAKFARADGGMATRYFAIIGEFGAGGAVVDRVNHTSKRFGGFLSFLWGILATMWGYKAHELTLEIDGERFSTTSIDVLVSNAPYYGGGIHAAPNARLDSGYFEVFVFTDFGFFTALRKLPSFYNGTFIKNRKLVRTFQARHIHAESPERVLINLDGEQPGQLPVTIDILPQTLPIVTRQT